MLSRSYVKMAHIQTLSKKAFTGRDLQQKNVISKLDKESKSLYNNVKSNLTLIDFHHVLNI